MSDMPVKLERRGAIAVVTIDNPPVNALGLAVRQRLLELVPELEADGSVAGVVLTGAGSLFVGGADITEFERPPQVPHLPEVLERIERSGKPWVAAVNGPALGGGAELALACHYRLVSPKARFGLPEINLGIIPGAGGTQRLPRLVGVEAALPVIAENAQIDAQRAIELHLAGLVEGDFLEGVISAAAEMTTRPLPSVATELPVADPGEGFWTEAAARIRKSAKGAKGPLAALESLRLGVQKGAMEGLSFERETFLRLRASDEAAALRYLFFAERSAFRSAALRGVEPRRINLAGVVGGGTMGVGIATALLNAGLTVVLSERDAASLDRARTALEAVFAAQAKRKIHSDQEGRDRLARLSGRVGLDELAGCDVVIEAVFEDLDVKRDVFARLSQVCRADAILATNTSYIDPRLIVEGFGNQERFIGLHFFSPAQVMKLLEIIPLPQTAADVKATGFDLAKRLAKVPVRAGICEGFIGNRILKRYRGEAEQMVAEGVDFAAIDAALRDFGYAMGPFEMQDLAGLDISFMNREAARGRGENVPETLGDILVRAGRKGQKTGGGWYDYEPGERKPQPSAATARLLAPSIGTPKQVDSRKIIGRLINAMADEGRKILEEGIADSPEAIDLVEVHGYGFPRGKGGPMFLSARNAI
ncbi:MULTISPECIES: 3-hydroxyacyl-CoA dehydrogenase NAD-binding domain-containing protein [unclassified Mesorhizobium]|uniref:3-hydroxyacyl-CoA dehydrogenase NAD-binding domain-containing protein n=1 Tax=unclassified Mesorhizobium TaxID=325217 RepID=UPI001FDFDD41|nr:MULTISPECIES: 3-hydroxyacyl-CoA dehydrogenase NAD-binding domain-containing protein [unclassified Mesorhizobium]